MNDCTRILRRMSDELTKTAVAVVKASELLLLRRRRRHHCLLGGASMIDAQPRSDSRHAWRFRRCPSCRTVRGAGEFLAVRFGPSWTDGRISRRCPACGHVAPTWRFRVVRERRGGVAGAR